MIAKKLSTLRRLSLAALAALALVTASAPATPAAAQFGVVVDLRNLAQNILHYRKRLQEYDAQRRQLTAQLDAMRKLSRPNWRDIGLLARQLDQVVAQANGIAYSLRDAERLFRETFPGYQPPAGGWTPQHARTQTQRTLGTLQGVVAAAGAHGQEIQASMRTLSDIKARMASTAGPQQAVELQTTMAGFAADQAAMLRQAVVMQTNALAVVEAQKLQQQAAATAVMQQAAQRMAGYRPHASVGFTGSRNAGGAP